MDYRKICRACLSEGDLQNLFNITSAEFTMLISEMLMACASVKVAENDGFPSQICTSCYTQIHVAYKFRQTCEQTDAILQQNKTMLKDECHIRDDVDQIKTEPSLKFEQASDNESNRSIVSNKSTISEEHVATYRRPERRRVKKKPLPHRTTLKNGDTLNKLRCKKCNETFDNATQLSEHMKHKRHPMKRNHFCEICSKSFTLSQLKIHMRSHTKEKPITCDICGQQFSLHCNLRRHMMLHTGEQPKEHKTDKLYTCDICGQSFSFNCNLRRHMMTHTGERPHNCPICNKGFIQSNNLQNHLRVHTGEEPFVCNICGKGFRQAERLRYHLKKHDDSNQPKNNTPPKRKVLTEADRTHICVVCQKGYLSKAALKTHMLIHGDKSFLCSECGKGFVSKPLLQSHSKVHTGLKPYLCNICERRFSHYVSLKAHTLVHTGEKPFACKLCSKMFTQRHHLVYHMRTHSGEKPYCCSVCGKSFSLNCNLTVHMRMHSGETPYVCPVCGKGFYDSSSMKKHQKSHTDI